MSDLYIAYNADTSALTGPFTLTATAATVAPKTILQLKPGSQKIRITEWGYGFSAAPANPVTVELIETGTVFATVTTIGSGIRNYSDATGAASLAVAGTSATGYNASAEGSITTSRLLAMNIDVGIWFKQQFSLELEPQINASSSCRIRATPSTAASVNMWCYLIWRE